MSDRPLWVFGYGSLMWNPGFRAAERVQAALPEFHRSFCMSSIIYRGTVENPGLVLGLAPARGVACRGVAFRVAEGEEGGTLDYLRERELVSSAYEEQTHLLRLDDGREVEAVTYVVDTSHELYAADLSLEDQARIIARAEGGRGRNAEYLWNTVAHLAELGIRDADLEWLAARVRDLAP
jgi:cation transport protein ChaC